jgi:hypothetical protein
MKIDNKMPEKNRIEMMTLLNKTDSGGGYY